MRAGTTFKSGEIVIGSPPSPPAQGCKESSAGYSLQVVMLHDFVNAFSSRLRIRHLTKDPQERLGARKPNNDPTTVGEIDFHPVYVADVIDL